MPPGALDMVRYSEKSARAPVSSVAPTMIRGELAPPWMLGVELAISLSIRLGLSAELPAAKTIVTPTCRILSINVAP
jgi:hypothetical protein